jgi:beta-glucanase (GH16 family)
MVLVLSCGPTGHADTELNVPGHRLVWNDEFEAPSVDLSKWDVAVGVNAWYRRASDGRYVEPQWFNEPFAPWTQAGTINGERQYYSPNNVTVNDGVLQIQARREAVVNPVGIYDPQFHRYTSGKLNTADEFQFRFGIVRWRAQLPAGQGMWPALWLLNAPDPWYWDDEIDVMEARGSLPNITTSAHHFKVGADRVNQYNSAELNTGLNLQAGFHEYGLEWTSSRIQTHFNDQVVFTDTEKVPQGPMFLIMNAAVGGMFDGAPANDAIFPSNFLIDWVRVWQPSPWPSDLADGDFETYQGAHWANWNTVDDGNLSTVTSGALHGRSSVRIGRLNTMIPGETIASNLLTDASAGGWSGWLNQLDANGREISGGGINPASIPATAVNDMVTLAVHQSAPSPGANAVVYRQLGGALVRGLNLTYTGTIEINEAFPVGTEALAFIRIFRGDYSFYDVATSVKTGGKFTIQAAIPLTNVAFIQAGLETSGPTGSAGRLVATALRLVDDASAPPARTTDRTGFTQTVAARPGAIVRYGLLAANSAADPIGAGAEGRLRLEFLDSASVPISEVITPLVDATSPHRAIAWSLESVTPASAAWVRLSIERFTSDPESDTSGSMIADAVFLQVPGHSALPLFTGKPARRLVVRDGDPLVLDITVKSSSPVTYQWYHEGEKTVTTADAALVARPSLAGTHFVVARNAAGPVIGAVTALTVLDAGPDTDGDGISDTDETTVYGTDRHRADSDGDGLSDYHELFYTQTDPLSSASTFRINAVAMVAGQLELTFESVPGLEYQVEASSDLVGWAPAGPAFVATEKTTTHRDPLPFSAATPRFLRVTVNP